MKPVISWLWSFGDNTYSNIQNPVHTYPLGGVYNVMLISSNYVSCTDTSVQQVVIENFKPLAGHDTTIVKNETIGFNGQGGINYNWSPGNYLSDSNIANPTGFYPDTGTFTYFLHVISAYGCQGTDTVKVHVVDQVTFFVPTAFTPNHDGKNDFFRPVAIGYKQLNYLKIFNRWGQMVYSTSNFETGWDGTVNGRDADMDTYYWEISYIDRNGNQGKTKGDIALIR
jgi:gliding motility-associated-like protein